MTRITFPSIHSFVCLISVGLFLPLEAIGQYGMSSAIQSSVSQSINSINRVQAVTNAQNAVNAAQQQTNTQTQQTATTTAPTTTKTDPNMPIIKTDQASHRDAENQISDSLNTTQQTINRETANGNFLTNTAIKTPTGTTPGGDPTGNAVSSANTNYSSDVLNKDQRSGSEGSGMGSVISSLASVASLGIAAYQMSQGAAHSATSATEAGLAGEAASTGDEEGATLHGTKSGEEAGIASMHYGLGALSALQAMMQLASSLGNSSKSAEDRSNGRGYNPYGSIGALNTIPEGTKEAPKDNKTTQLDLNNISQSQLETMLPQNGKALVDMLKDQGYSFDYKNGSLTTPNGTVLKDNDFNNPSKLDTAFGAPSGATAKAMEQSAEMEAKIAAENGLGGAAGGNLKGGALGGLGGSSLQGGGALAMIGLGNASDLAGYGEGEDGTGGFGGLSNNNGRGKNNGTGKDGRDLASNSPFSGLSKNYNGENIGVAEDNIFGMVNRRYNLKQNQNEFIIGAKRPQGLPVVSKTLNAH